MGKMIGIEEAAARLGVTRARVHILCKQRRIPGARLVGRLWMLPEDFKVTPATRGPALGSRK
jgi:excisionase family DNA binding protein